MGHATVYKSDKSKRIKTDKGQEQLWKKSINPKSVDYFKNKQNYDYSVVKNKTLWEEIQFYLRQLINTIIHKLGILWEIRYFLLLLLILAVTILILKKSNIDIFRPNPKVATVVISDNVNPNTIDWDKAISKAIKNKDYKIAIRYQFLAVLKYLNQNNWIIWKAEKTNYDYIREIKDSKMQQHFLQLSNLYEVAWYGDYPITEIDYQQINQNYKQFNQLYHKNNNTQ